MKRANPLKGILSMAGGMLPKLSEHLSDLNQPEETGGLLKEDWDRVTYLMTEHEGKIILSLVPIRINEAGERVIERPLRNLSLEDLIKHGLDGNQEDEA